MLTMFGGRWLASVILLVLSGVVCGGEGNRVSDTLQNASVTVRAGRSEGSGVIVTRGESSYVLTAGHVVEGLRTTREVINGDGSKRTLIEFKDTQVIKQLVEDGRTVGKAEFDAEVLRYSGPDHGDDLALLRIRTKNFVRSSVAFYSDEEIPGPGSPLFHVGSLLGQFGAGSLTSGIVSQIGRLYQGRVYDQCQVVSFPGSSGGGVFLHDGRYMGMVVRGAGENFTLIVPIRRIRQWADRVGIPWLINDELDVPPGIERGPIEDTAHQFPERSELGEFSFLIHQR